MVSKKSKAANARARVMKETLPFAEMQRARLTRDASYDGVFWVGVRTMNVFCLPSCLARQPLDRNVIYFTSYQEAVQAGFRPCKRCRPPEPAEHLGETVRCSAEALARQAAVPTLTTAEEQAASRRSVHSSYSTATKTKSADAIVTLSLQSPLGELVVGATERGLCLLEYADRHCLSAQIATIEKLLGCRAFPGVNQHLDQIAVELARYFDGEISRFDTPLEIAGTRFERAVWKCLIKIPYGDTVSYSQIAKEIGHPDAQRAVGRANGSNKMAIVIPCHRVVKTTGTLGGYGGGLWKKHFLLDLERSYSGRLLKRSG